MVDEETINWFCARVASFYGMKAIPNPGRKVDSLDAELMICNHPRSTVGVFACLVGVLEPVWCAPDYGLDAQFTARLNRGDYARYTVQHHWSDYWIFFWLEFGGAQYDGYTLVPIHAVYLSTIGGLAKQPGIINGPVDGDDWLFDVRVLRQLKFQPGPGWKELAV